MEKISKPVHNWIWDGRIDDQNDDEANRIHQVIEKVSVDELIHKPAGIALLGYACDEGVRRNKGRVGASEGPNEIRKALGSMAAHCNTPLYDLGDCVCKDDMMEANQETFSKSISTGLSSNQLMIGLGGGHDIAYANGSGIYHYLENKNVTNKNGGSKKLGIINLDAHFDLRQPMESSNSGTPFYQLAQEHPDNFNYLVVGIQRYGNTQRLFTTADELGVTYILRDDLQSNFEQSLKQIKSFIGQVDHIYLTIDLDGLDSSICPGVSAPSVNGISLTEILVILELILASNKLMSLDLAELNPSHDQDNRTAKVAAYLVHRVIGR